MIPTRNMDLYTDSIPVMAGSLAGSVIAALYGVRILSGIQASTATYMTNIVDFGTFGLIAGGLSGAVVNEINKN